MPIGLRVKLQSDTTAIGELLPRVSDALQDILRLRVAPRIVAEEWLECDKKTIEPQTISTKAGMISFKILGEPDVAYLHYFVSAVHELGDKASPQAGVIVGSGRRPLDFALAAAVAAALARENNSEVVDDTPYFSDELEQSADLFIESVRVKQPFADYRDAGQVFFQGLYGERRDLLA